MKDGKNTDCDCDCHYGAKVNHWQYTSGEGYKRSPCSCEIEGNPNFVPKEIRDTWKQILVTKD